MGWPKGRASVRWKRNPWLGSGFGGTACLGSLCRFSLRRWAKPGMRNPTVPGVRRWDVAVQKSIRTLFPLSPHVIRLIGRPPGSGAPVSRSGSA